MRYYYLGTLERGTATEDMGERIYPEKAPEHPAQLQYHSIWFSHLSTYFTSGWQPTPVFLPGESHGQRSLVGSSPWGHKESDMTERLHFHFSLSCTGEGNGNPLQCSCLESPRNGGPWWVAVYGVAQIRTRLK